MRSSIRFALALLVGSAAAVSAQERGTVEVGGFGQLTGFDEQTTLTGNESWGLGGFLGVFLAPNLALEGAASRTWTEDGSPAGVDGTWNAWRARLVLGLPVSEGVLPLLGVGYVRNDYDDAVDGTDGGMTGLVGIKAYMSERVAFRGDVQLDYMWEPFNAGEMFRSSEIDSHLNWTASAGLSIDIGAGRHRDSDRDGVRDDADVCPETPMGVSVDALGCRMDTDRDGVFDEDDQCFATPAGARVDATGCRVDADGDGVYDENDRCADTPAGVGVDADGCRIDTDRDGVFDGDDQCAATPAGALVDERGCRVDTDGDGVYDENDRCADTEAGVAVDAQGCPEIFAPEETSVVLEGVTFETGSAQLTAGAREILNRVAQSLVANGDIRVRVTGHTDATGPRALNTELSQDRAESVMRYLVERGVASARLEARGYGPDRPVASNDSAEGRRMNRRVELERIN